MSVCRKQVHTLILLQHPQIRQNRKQYRIFLDRIENQELYHVLITVDRLTLQIVMMKIQGYSTHEIAKYLKITEKSELET